MDLHDDLRRRIDALGVLAETLPALSNPHERDDTVRLLRTLATIQDEAKDLLARVAVSAVAVPRLSIAEISEASGVARPQVYRWKRRFLEEQGPDLFEGIDRDDSVPSDWRD